MGKEILEGGLNELDQIKQKLTQLDGYKEQKKALDAQENKLGKSVSAKEKAIESEISKVTKERRAQVEATYDEQIDSVRATQKKVQAKKDKTKKAAVEERINAETAEFKNEDEALKLGGKSIFKQENIPFMYNNRLFFALYFPRGFGDVCIIILTLVLLLFVIPFGVYYIWFLDKSILFLVLFYVIIVVVFGGLYLIIGKTKHRHHEALDRVREMRRKIYESKRQQARIKRKIKRDKDESGYGLEEYNSEIYTLQSQINGFLQQKKDALNTFENVTRPDIKQQITASNQAELDNLKAGYKKAYDEGRENQSRLNNLAVQVASEYEGYIGKDLLTVEKIGQMEQLIANGSAANIADAAAKVRQK